MKVHFLPQRVFASLSLSACHISSLFDSFLQLMTPLPILAVLFSIYVDVRVICEILQDLRHTVQLQSIITLESWLGMALCLVLTHRSCIHEMGV